MSLSQSDLSGRFERLADEVAAIAEDLLERDAQAEASSEMLGRAIAALGRLYAQKIQDGEALVPASGNTRMSVTDAAILCTAVMDSVGLELFELGGWQTMTDLGKIRKAGNN